jgi:hypothetical protein
LRAKRPHGLSYGGSVLSAQYSASQMMPPCCNCKSVTHWHPPCDHV